MSESNAGKLPLVVAVVLIAVVGAGYYFMNPKASEPDMSVEVPQPEVIEETSSNDIAPDAQEAVHDEHDHDHSHSEDGHDHSEDDVVEVVEDQEELVDLSASESKPSSFLDDGTPLQVRAIGNPDAPITLVEYSSLSCGHCAQFHKGTLPALKEKYVDTGKVYMVFREFPLNKSAIDASKVLRCMPEDKYYSFMNLLFDTQAQWAFSGDHLGKLKQSAKLAGLNDEQIDACLSDTGLEEDLAAGLKIGSQTYGVRSTPSFVVNGGAKLISGNQRLSFFEKVFDELLATPSEGE